MLTFLSWYFLITLLGCVTFPLAWRLFPSLADRGYTLARALGLFVWGYLFWLLGVLGVLPNTPGGLLVAFLLLIGGIRLALGRSPASLLRLLWDWLHENRKFVFTVETLFFLAFAVWTFVRASNPNIETAGGEKTMELAFINAILRAPIFPPHDPWLSGYAISYYYFGYVLTAMLARASSVSGAVAHNLMLALIFALSAVGAYGLLYNLLVAFHRSRRTGIRPSLALPLFAPLFLLLIGNLGGLLETLHRRGLFWSGQPGDSNLWTVLGRFARPNLQAYNFWTWLDIRHLNQPPREPLQWTPDRYIWWWQSSRVLQDYDLAGNFREIIDEFPAFSYLLGDLHPHVLAMPFVFLVVSVAFNLFLGGWKPEPQESHWPFSPLLFVSAALLLGGLAFLNTWDILPGFALLLGAYGLRQVRQYGWSWMRLGEAVLFGLSLLVLAFVFFLPFHLSFSSQAGGILPNLENPTRGAHLWVMFGTLFVPLFGYLFALQGSGALAARWKLGVWLSIGLTFVLWAFSWFLALLIKLRMPDFATAYLHGQGIVSEVLFFGAASLRRLTHLGSLLTLLALLIPSLAFLVALSRQQSEPDSAEDAPSPLRFTVLLILLGTLLVLAPEFVYLRDLFGNRMNTIFKFYYQAWMLWSIAAGFGVAFVIQNGQRRKRQILLSLDTFAILAGALFLIFALPNKTDGFRLDEFRNLYRAARTAGVPDPLRQAASVWTLDGTRLFRSMYPADAEAADWLASAPFGVVAEAVGGQYSDYARMSVYSGLPTVVGWPGHEDQWRGTFEEQRRRAERDIPTLYESLSWEEALQVIQRYQIRYVVVGTLERRTYRINEINFQRHLVPVFRNGEVVIYQVP
ncbi:MAG: DUF2298 domain-containing protein [Anaerolineales bacterium]|nr:DUF2298 domain-containing protein [Anaerolineales bacterium]